MIFSKQDRKDNPRELKSFIINKYDLDELLKKSRKQLSDLKRKEKEYG